MGRRSRWSMSARDRRIQDHFDSCHHRSESEKNRGKEAHDAKPQHDPAGPWRELLCCANSRNSWPTSHPPAKWPEQVGRLAVERTTRHLREDRIQTLARPCTSNAVVRRPRPSQRNQSHIMDLGGQVGATYSQMAHRFFKNTESNYRRSASNYSFSRHLSIL